MQKDMDELEASLQESDNLIPDDASLSETSKQVAKLRASNDATIQRLAKLGAEVTGLDTARDNSLMRFIYERLMMESQREDFLLQWHTELAETLKPLEVKARERVVAEAALRSKPAGGLALPQPRKLVLPGQ